MESTNQRINKQVISKEVATVTGMRQYHVARIVDELFDYIIRSIGEGKTISIHGLGSWKVIEKKRARYRDLKGHIQTSPEHRIPKFAFSREVRRLVRE